MTGGRATIKAGQTNHYSITLSVPRPMREGDALFAFQPMRDGRPAGWFEAKP
jgi:hypothetical protein